MKRAPFAIPGSIKIRGKRWQIYRDCDMTGEDGFTFRPKRKIKLRRGQSQWEEASTFIHELLHACSNCQAAPAHYEEAFIREVEKALLGALAQLKWRK